MHNIAVATIDAQNYTLVSSDALNTAAARIVELVRRGGGILRLVTLDTRRIDVLITPNTTASFEVHSMSEEGIDADEAEQFVDFDVYSPEETRC